MEVEPKLTLEQQLEFVELFAQTSRPVETARKLGLSVSDIRHDLTHCPSFRNAYQESLLSYRDRIVKEVYRRGVEGWEEPVFYRGEPVMRFDEETGKVVPVTIRKYDSSLLQMEAKRVEPGYRNQIGDVGQSGGNYMPDQLASVAEDDSDDDTVKVVFVKAGEKPMELEDKSKETVPSD